MMKHNRLFLSGILAMGLPVLGIAQDNITGFEDAAGYTKPVSYTHLTLPTNSRV